MVAYWYGVTLLCLLQREIILDYSFILGKRFPMYLVANDAILARLEENNIFHIQIVCHL